MELLPILTRAESLFRRFERVVQAVDKKNNFPAPSNVGQINPTSPRRKSSSRLTSNASQNMRPGKEKVISPELRQLLSRENTTANSSSSSSIMEQAGPSTAANP